MPASAFTVAILAGGAATRLGGRDKGLELLGGRPLIEWVIDALAGMEPAKSSPSRGRLSGDGVHCDATSIAAEAVPTMGCGDTLIVANRHLDEYARRAPAICDSVSGFHGPLAGIAAALAQYPIPWLLTVPVDCPDPPRDLALRLAEVLREADAAAVVAHDGERRQPLFALYRRELAQSAADALATGQGVHRWQNSIGAREVDFSDRRRQFHNLNTREDFIAYAERHRLAG
ncbi:MAG: molybdenum cofactor guanylyltransferase [Lysobacterales bacterium]